MKKARPMYTTTLEGVDSPLTEEAMVELYLNINGYWFTMRENKLYGMRKEAKELINHWLRTGQELPKIRYPLIYLINHFQNDFMPHFKRVQWV